MKVLRLAIPIVALLLWAENAGATTVAIVAPPTRSDDVKQVLTLLRGELLAAGLDVETSDRSATEGQRARTEAAWLEGFAERGMSAVVDAIGDDTLESIDVWILKTHPRRFEVTHVAVEPDAVNQPGILALRAFEALSAGLLQLDWAARKQHREPVAKPPVETVVADVAPKPRLHRELVGVELGGVASMSLDGVGAALSPTLRLAWVARSWLLIQASAAGFGSRATVSAAAGGAKVAQQQALLGASCRLRSAHRLWPFLTLAAGVLRTSADGEAGWGTGARSAVQWSKLVDVGLGVGGEVHRNFYATLSAHAQLAEPYVAFHITDAVATSGRPNLLLALTVGAWL